MVAPFMGFAKKKPERFVARSGLLVPVCDRLSGGCYLQRPPDRRPDQARLRLVPVVVVVTVEAVFEIIRSGWCMKFSDLDNHVADKYA